jgi:DNA-directed RNA polymerase subunit alpha
MAILDFQKPDKVIMIESDDFRGQFEFRPLEPGYGVTVGNALRRILLSSWKVLQSALLKLKALVTSSLQLKVWLTM